MRGQSLVHPALFSHHRCGTKRRLQEDSLSDEDPTETDSGGLQSENEFKGRQLDSFERSDPQMMMKKMFFFPVPSESPVNNRLVISETD